MDRFEDLRGLERLTRKSPLDGVVLRCCDGKHNRYVNCKYAACDGVEVALDRLAAYEDTGLTPEQVTRLQSELAEARERAEAAEHDLQTMADRTETCTCCANFKKCGGNDPDCCWEWRGPQGREGAGNEHDQAN